MVTKKQLNQSKNKLKNVHDNFISSLILSVAMSDKSNEDYFRKCAFFADKEEFKLIHPQKKNLHIPTPNDYYLFSLPDNEYFLSKEFSVLNFLKCIVRVTTNDSFEAVTMAFRNSANKLIIEGHVTKQDWYPLAWIIRNCLTHDQTFSFGKTHKKLLPIKWRGVEITASMEGTEAKGGTYWIFETYELITEMRKFIESEIKNLTTI